MVPVMSPSMQQEETRCPRPSGMSHTSEEARRNSKYLSLNYLTPPQPHAAGGRNEEEQGRKESEFKLEAIVTFVNFHHLPLAEIRTRKES